MTLDHHISLTAGRLLYRQIRDYVGERNARGFHLSLWEGAGWLERPFVISGPPEELQRVSEDLQRWLAQMETS